MQERIQSAARGGPQPTPQSVDAVSGAEEKPDADSAEIRTFFSCSLRTPREGDLAGEPGNPFVAVLLNGASCRGESAAADSVTESLDVSSAFSTAVSMQAAGDDAFIDSLDPLLPTEADNDMFEVILPDGGKLGVVVNATSEHIAYFLNPPDRTLGERIDRHKAVLEKRLGSRIGKRVRLAVF